MSHFSMTKNSPCSNKLVEYDVVLWAKSVWPLLTGPMGSFFDRLAVCGVLLPIVGSQNQPFCSTILVVKNGQRLQLVLAVGLLRPPNFRQLSIHDQWSCSKTILLNWLILKKRSYKLLPVQFNSELEHKCQNCRLLFTPNSIRWLLNALELRHKLLY